MFIIIIYIPLKTIVFKKINKIKAFLRSLKKNIVVAL